MTISFIKLYVIFFFFYKPKNKMEKINKLLKATFVSCRHLYLMLYIIFFSCFSIFPFVSFFCLSAIIMSATWHMGCCNMNIFVHITSITLSKTIFTYGRYPIYRSKLYTHFTNSEYYITFSKFCQNLSVFINFSKICQF